MQAGSWSFNPRNRWCSSNCHACGSVPNPVRSAALGAALSTWAVLQTLPHLLLYVLLPALSQALLQEHVFIECSQRHACALTRHPWTPLNRPLCRHEHVQAGATVSIPERPRQHNRNKAAPRHTPERRQHNTQMRPPWRSRRSPSCPQRGHSRERAA